MLAKTNYSNIRHKKAPGGKYDMISPKKNKL